MVFLVVVSLGCADNRQQSKVIGHSDRSSQAVVGGAAFAESSFDAGSVLAGHPVKHTFLFANESDSKLILAPKGGIKKSCGCSSAEVIQASLAPGEKTEVIITINTGGKQGRFAERVALVWHDTLGDEIAKVYTIRGAVNSAFKLFPPQVHITKVAMANQGIFCVDVQSDTPMDWSTLSASSENKAIIADVERSEEKGRIYIKLNESEFDGPLSCVVRVRAQPTPADGKVARNPYRLYAELPISIGNLKLSSIKTKTALFKYDDESSHFVGQVIVQHPRSQSSSSEPDIRVTILDDGNGILEARVAHQSLRLTDSLIRIDLKIPKLLLAGEVLSDCRLAIFVEGSLDEEIPIIEH